MSSGVDDNIDLRVITEEELKQIEDLANKSEELANKAEAAKLRAKKAVKDISDESKNLGIGGAPADIGKLSNMRVIPVQGAAGENALEHNLGQSPIGGQPTSDVPQGMEKRIQDAETKADKAEQDAQAALKASKKHEKQLSDFQSKYEEALGAVKNLGGYAGSQITKLLGKSGLAGMTALFGYEVVTDMFDLVKSWFDTPGGFFDIRKKMKDAVYNIGNLQYQESIASGNVFFTPDTNLYQHSPYHSNTEKMSNYQMRYVYSSKYD